MIRDHLARRRALRVAAIIAAVPCAVAASQVQAHAGSGGIAQNGFTQPVMLPDSSHAIEPSITVDSAGRLFVTAPQYNDPRIPGYDPTKPPPWVGSPVWRSTDGGQSWDAPVRPTGDPSHGGDTDITVDSRDNVYQADLWPESVAMAVSTDHGQTFLANEVGTVDGGDRPWLAYSPHDNVLYQVINDGTTGLVVSRSLPLVTPQAGLIQPVESRAVTECGLPDSACTGPFESETDCSCPPGGIAVDRTTGEVYVTYGRADGEVGVAYSTDQGMTWAKTGIPGTGSLGDSRTVSYNFQPIAVDARGTVYVAWGEAIDAQRNADGTIASPGGVAIRLSRSTDHGRTWSTPITVSTATATNVFPALALGAPGVVYVGYLGTAQATSPDFAPDSTSWNLMVSTSTDALEATPQFETEVAVAGVHDGCIRVIVSLDAIAAGSGCAREANGGGLGDFFTMATAPDGRLDIAYTAGQSDPGVITIGVDPVFELDNGSPYSIGNVYFTSRAGRTPSHGGTTTTAGGLAPLGIAAEAPGALRLRSF